MTLATATAPVAVPGYFGPADRPLFGWYHPAGAESARVGVVVCSPLGYESLCCHRTVRRVSELAAARGLPAIRFDYDGTWDSAGSDLDPARVPAWIASIEAAIEALRAVSGVASVCLVGIRVGAMLATLVARQRSDVACIVAIAPVVDGRRYLRELRALAATSAIDAESLAGDQQEAAGFTTTAETREAFGAIGPADLSPRTGTRVLLLERDDLPTDERWSKALAAAGISVTSERLRGYAEMMRDAHDSKVPQQSLEQAMGWIARNEPGGAPARLDGAPYGRDDVQCVLRPIANLPGDIDEVVLQPGGPPRGFAIAATPAAASRQANRPLVLLLNSGAVHHVGPYRLFVSLARRLAASGVTVVRYDLPAIGDGDAYADRIDDAPYPATAVADIHRSLAALVERFAPSCVHFGGVCAGAYHSLKSAQQGPAVRSIIVVNPLTFFWKPGLPLDVKEFHVTAEAARYQRTLFEPTAWLKLLRGQVAILPIARTFARRLRSRSHHHLRDLQRVLGQPLEDDLANELLTIARRGTSIEFLFADNEPGLPMLREQGGRTVKRLQRRQMISIETIEGADHTFSSLEARERLMTLFERRIRGAAKPDSG